jgi:hypothetical protein
VAKTAPSKTSHISGWNGFNIERHILVGRVEPGNGDRGPIAEAFLQIGQYMEENDDADGYDVSFEVFGRSFRAQIEPEAGRMSSLAQPHDQWEDD